MKTESPASARTRSRPTTFRISHPKALGRAAVRLDPIFNVDAALTKAFRLPWGGKRRRFRAEAFNNVFNHPNFTNPSLSLESPQTFGEYQGTMDPRSVQFALRFEY